MKRVRSMAAGLLTVILLLSALILPGSASPGENTVDLSTYENFFSVKVGESITLSHVNAPAGAKVTYAPYSEEFLKISGNKVTGVKPGLTIIDVNVDGSASTTALIATYPTSGSCSTATTKSDLTWSVDTNNCLLTVKGKGAMPDYESVWDEHSDNPNASPWYFWVRACLVNRYDVVLEPGITNISAFSFATDSTRPGVRRAIIPASVTKISGSAFYPAGYGNSDFYFCGDAPEIGFAPFDPDSATLYYIEGKRGWTDSPAYDAATGTWNGYKLKTWSGNVEQEQLLSLPFKDVPRSALFYDAVDYVYKNGIMSGTGKDTFAPGNKLTRAMVVQTLYNVEGKPAVNGKHGFPDVSADQWYNNAVTWAAQKGVVGGYGDGRFGPDDSVTLEQVAVILWNYRGKPGTQNVDANYYAEYISKHAPSDWAMDAMCWAQETRVLRDVAYTKPQEQATRAQIAQMLTNYLTLGLN